MRQIFVGRPGSLARTMAFAESKQLVSAGGADTRSAADLGPSSGRLKPCRVRRLRPVALYIGLLWKVGDSRILPADNTFQCSIPPWD